MQKACKSCRSRQELSNAIPTRICLQNLVSIQPRTSLSKLIYFSSYGIEFSHRYPARGPAPRLGPQPLAAPPNAAYASSKSIYPTVCHLANFIRTSEVRKMKEKMRKLLYMKILCYREDGKSTEES